MTAPARTTAATWGLLLAWAVHDGEELRTMPGWVGRARPRLERRFPRVPAGVWDRLAADERRTAYAVGLVGVVMAAAAVAGARTGGRSSFYRGALSAFGVHGYGHLALSAVTGGYTPGVLTAPTVVLPFTWWAHRQLRAAGIEPARPTAAQLALIPVVLGAAQAGAAGLVRLRRRPGRS